MEDCFTLIDNNNKDNNITIDKNQIITFNNKQYILKKSGLIFVSMRLGINKVSREYYSSIKYLFNCKECMGIIGGETNLAHYFIGYNDKGNLIYLDPHITRDVTFELPGFPSLFESIKYAPIFEYKYSLLEVTSSIVE